jgi:hypothetical protein
MKKMIIAIITVIYMSISSGIAMDIHYCMGKLTGFELYGKENDLCGKCGMKNKKGCCGDNYKFYKLSDSHKNVYNNISFTLGSIAVAKNYSSYNWHLSTTIATNAVANNSPPLYTRPSACIMNCVFRL